MDCMKMERAGGGGGRRGRGPACQALSTAACRCRALGPEAEAKLVWRCLHTVGAQCILDGEWTEEGSVFPTTHAPRAPARRGRHRPHALSSRSFSAGQREPRALGAFAGSWGLAAPVSDTMRSPFSRRGRACPGVLPDGPLPRRGGRHSSPRHRAAQPGPRGQRGPREEGAGWGGASAHSPALTLRPVTAQVPGSRVPGCSSVSTDVGAPVPASAGPAVSRCLVHGDAPSWPGVAVTVVTAACLTLSADFYPKLFTAPTFLLTP